MNQSVPNNVTIDSLALAIPAVSEQTRGAQKLLQKLVNFCLLCKATNDASQKVSNSKKIADLILNGTILALIYKSEFFTDSNFDVIEFAKQQLTHNNELIVALCTVIFYMHSFLLEHTLKQTIKDTKIEKLIDSCHKKCSETLAKIPNIKEFVPSQHDTKIMLLCTLITTMLSYFLNYLNPQGA